MKLYWRWEDVPKECPKCNEPLSYRDSIWCLFVGKGYVIQKTRWPIRRFGIGPFTRWYGSCETCSTELFKQIGEYYYKKALEEWVPKPIYTPTKSAVILAAQQGDSPQDPRS